MSPGLGALLLVIAANVAPWGAARLMRGRWHAPLDGGAQLADGRRVLGEHKSWCGLLAGIVGCAVTAPFVRQPMWVGAVFGALALSGDAASSFIKRRLRLRPGTEVPGLDQLPEALVPLLVLAGPLGLRRIDALLVAAIFMVLDLGTVRLRHLET